MATVYNLQTDFTYLCHVPIDFITWSPKKFLECTWKAGSFGIDQNALYYCFEKSIVSIINMPRINTAIRFRAKSLIS